MQNLEELGFNIYYDFITVEEEATLLNNFVKFPPKKIKSRNSIQRFGSDKPYKSSMVSKSVPEYFNFVLDKIEPLMNRRPDSVTINEYTQGQEITPHIDSRSSGPIITVLSLQSEATMILQLKQEKHKVLLPARCLITMKNVIREKWNHSIQPVKDSRYSVVFRCSN